MEHKELTFVHRTNIKIRNSKDLDKETIKELHAKNHISIHMWIGEEDKHIKEWKSLMDGEEITNVNHYVKQFYNIYLASKENDVLIYAKYADCTSKLGLVKKSSDLIIDDDDKSRVFYCFELKETKEIDKSDFPLLETVIPYYSTVSKVVKGREKLLSVFYKDFDLSMKIENLSAKATELLCIEWLRSKFNQKHPIKYQLMPSGGNNSDIDFLGQTKNDDLLVSQITTSNNKKTIDDKIKILKDFNGAKHKIMFGQKDELKTDNEVEYISIQKVWEDFQKPYYKDLLKFLIYK